AELAAPGGSLYGIQHTNDGKIVVFGGGEPLYIDDVMVGAIGVSGGTAEQDTRLGEFGKNKIKDVIAWK
ncbi:MAG: heme-binding protein, partial [Lachnospiraceae bacterium]|nr:heme-binding protein [Lachnospiraceae bacterium]